MKIKTITGAGPETGAALLQIGSAVRGCGLSPQLAIVLYDTTHDDLMIHAQLRELLPATRLIGGTSFNGFMSEVGVFPAGSIGLMMIEDEQGNYGVAAAPKGADPSATAERLVHEALADADCAGQIPEAIWIFQAPGDEERVLEGVHRVLQDGCPVYGGSVADNDVSGKWREMATSGVMDDGIVIAVMFPSGALGHAFQGGCSPSGPSGVVTAVADTHGAGSGREIVSIDNRPAAHVFNEWIGGAVDDEVAHGGDIMAKTVLHPLAIQIEQDGDTPHYLLVCTVCITPEGHLRTLTNLRQGQRIYLMQGNPRRLVQRAGSVASCSLRQLGGSCPPRGALLAFCGVLRIAVGDALPEAAESIRASLGNIPFLSAFTFGEQGVVSGRNLHGNLMISVMSFGGS